MNDSEPVKLWRDFAHLNLSESWKHDVTITVTDIELWKQILANWKWRDAKGKWHRKAPGIKGLLDEYERRRFDAIQQNGSGVHCEKSVSERTTRRMPKSELPALYAGKRL